MTCLVKSVNIASVKKLLTEVVYWTELSGDAIQLPSQFAEIRITIYFETFKLLERGFVLVILS